jgi:hypothetical protein
MEVEPVVLTLRSAEAAGSRPARPCHHHCAAAILNRRAPSGRLQTIRGRVHRLLHARAGRCANSCSHAGREQGAIEALAWRRTEFPTFSPPIGRRRLPADTGFNRIKFADPAQGIRRSSLRRSPESAGRRSTF